MLYSKLRLYSSAAAVLLAVSAPAIAEDLPPPDFSDDPIIDGFPAGMLPWRDPDNPNVQILKDDWDKYYKRRDMIGDNPPREPGPIDLQRYVTVPTKHAFPTWEN